MNQVFIFVTWELLTFSASFPTSLSFQIPKLHLPNPVLSSELRTSIYIFLVHAPISYYGIIKETTFLSFFSVLLSVHIITPRLNYQTHIFQILPISVQANVSQPNSVQFITYVSCPIVRFRVSYLPLIKTEQHFILIPAYNIFPEFYQWFPIPFSHPI